MCIQNLIGHNQSPPRTGGFGASGWGLIDNPYSMHVGSIAASFQMDIQVCARSILVSQLPDLDSEFLLDKLEIHFSKSSQGGGEVASRHFQEDTRNAVLVFTEDNSEHPFTSGQVSLGGGGW